MTVPWVCAVSQNGHGRCYAFVSLSHAANMQAHAQSICPFHLVNTSEHERSLHTKSSPTAHKEQSNLTRPTPSLGVFNLRGADAYLSSGWVKK